MRIAQTDDNLGRSAETQCLSAYVELPTGSVNSKAKLAWVHGKGEVGFKCPNVAADILIKLFERVAKSFGIGTVTAALDDGSHIYCTDSTDTQRQLDLYVLFPCFREDGTSYYSRYGYVPTCATYQADLLAARSLKVGELPAPGKGGLQKIAEVFANNDAVPQATPFDINTMNDRKLPSFFALSNGYMGELAKMFPNLKLEITKAQCDASWAVYSVLSAPDPSLPAAFKTAVDHLKSGTCRLMEKNL